VPVVVTGADRPLGRAVVEALLAHGVPEVRATVRIRAAVPELIALGVRTAVSDLVDPLRLGAVLEGAHTVVHLDPDDPLDSWDLLLEAAADTGLRRIVTLCLPSRVPPAECGYDLVVIRAASACPSPWLVAALVDADRREQVSRIKLVEPAEQSPEPDDR
jgi:NAD(P)-dependent dehydrogenase (short-subunit alcohol dehydrogenase family)